MKTISRYIMTLALLLTAVTGAWAQTQWTSGSCTVTLNNGTLTVSGNGAMADYFNSSDRPWHGNKGDITSVVVESGVTSVRRNAFESFTNLTSVTLPEGFTAIGLYAFSNCSSLQSITIPSTVTSIGDGAFDGCSAMTSVTLPEGLTAIGAGAFGGCSSLTSITIPSTVTSIGDYAFMKSKAISDVNLYANPDNLTWGITNYDFKQSKATKCHVLAEHLSAYQNNFSSVNVTFVGDLEPLPTPIEVNPVAEPAANTKQWTFTQPGSDVVLTPIYAKAAAFATESTSSGVKTLLPEAAEGVIAGTTAPLIVEGTVANAGTTENPQGLVMYYAAKGTADAAPTAPTLESLWSADVPTAEAYINDEDGAIVYVWYYIAGANTPDGEDPTADNTFNDSEICAKPLKVTLLSNKFDITLKAANANTIEAGNATVTVGGTDKTVTEGKLEGVKMGSEVKMTAKQGYKFRKVEVKKGAAEKTITIDGQNYTVLDGETWSQFISRNKLSGCYLTSMSLNTWSVCKPDADLHVSSDGTNWTLLQFSPKDAPIDTDKQYKWVTVSFDD